MPEITQNYELRKPGPTPGAKYPVDKWLQGLRDRTWNWKKQGSKGDQPALRLVQGRDFEIAPASMAEYLWKYRRDNAVPIRLATNPDHVLVFWEGAK